MYMLLVGLLAAFVWSGAKVEPNEDAMRQAFASDLADGVTSALAYVARTGGAQALARIRQAHTDAFEIRTFRKIDCRPTDDKPGHLCDFVVEVDTVAGPIEPLARRPLLRPDPPASPTTTTRSW